MIEHPYTDLIKAKIIAIIEAETLGLTSEALLSTEFQAGANRMKQQIIKVIKDAKL